MPAVRLAPSVYAFWPSKFLSRCALPTSSLLESPVEDLALTQIMYWSTCVPRDAFSLSSRATAPALRFSDVVVAVAIEICGCRGVGLS